MSNSIDWYFDFISPFAYLQQQKLWRISERITVRPVPVLFAGLLKHWEHKGPAEIPSKRIFTYQHAVWLGRQSGISLRMPPAHPFNPLPALRLSIALNNRPAVIDALFRYIWADGKALDDRTSWDALMRELAV